MVEPDPNPYQSPREEGSAVGVVGRELEDLRTLAIAQKCLTASIITYIFLILSAFLFPSGHRSPGPVFEVAAGLLFLGAFVTGIISGTVVATKLYGLIAGLIVGVFAFIPCMGLIPLVIANQRATNVLEANGFYVRFGGASLVEINARIRQRDDGQLDGDSSSAT